MSKKYHTARTVEITLDGNRVEVEAALSYTIAPFVPEPAEGDHVEWCKGIRFNIWCKGIRFIGTGAADAIKPDCPEWLGDWIVSVVDGESLYAEAMEYEAAERERAADDRYEMMREDHRHA